MTGFYIEDLDNIYLTSSHWGLQKLTLPELKNNLLNTEKQTAVIILFQTLHHHHLSIRLSLYMKGKYI
jgi:hypothetical protein